MLLSINWLKDYLQKAEIKIDPKELADKLTMRGLAVSMIKRPILGLETVLVGRIVTIEKHPNADRLQVTWVVTSEAEGAERRQIVCGATNIAEGDIVPVAMPGTVLPGDFEIKKSIIRGIDSYGMICSGTELGIAKDADGILQLPKHSPLGQPLSRLLGHDDTILEFELTPNRADCFSVLGLAREIAPVLKTKLREPKPARFRTTPHRTSSIIKIEVDDPELCPRYVARVIDTLKVAESPDWIKQRLESVGQRPINNIVDITNFVMMEYGQPLHAFDLRKIETGTIRVAPCKEPMDFTLLNGQTVRLEPGDILILDGDKPIALAGIMGGANSQIEPDSTSIILESAAFYAKQVRRTAKRLGLSSESSKRFEKGVDLAAVALASERAAALLRDGFNANVYHPPIDTNEFGVKEHILSVDMRDVRKVTGMKHLSSETAADVLESIGITSHKKSVNVLSIRLPSYRLDLRESVDVIEEVARLVGYEAIPENYPTSKSAYDRLDEGSFEFEQRTKGILCSLGLKEAIHYSFTSEDLFRKLGLYQENMISLKNPISEEMKVLRTTLLPSLLQTYLYNKNRKVLDQRLFEVAKCYFKDDSEETKVREITYASGLLSGNTFCSSWRKRGEAVDFYFVKGLLEILVRQLTSVFLAYEPAKNHPLLHPNRSAILKLGLKEIGCVGEVHPLVRSSFLETQEPVVLFEINLEALRKYERLQNRYKTPAKFPAIELDIAVVIDKAISAHSLLETIRHAGGGLLSDVSIFDMYEGDNIPMGKRSLAFHLNFLSAERTLEETEALSAKDRIVQTLAEKHNAQLRM